MNGASVPRALVHAADLEPAACYAPIIQFDAAEPFLPLAAGVTAFDAEADSPSFPRRILRELVSRWHKVIEYAIRWDWDIGHLYELEHAWSYIVVARAAANRRCTVCVTALVCSRSL